MADFLVCIGVHTRKCLPRKGNWDCESASVAHAAMRRTQLRSVVAEDHNTQLRLLSEHRDDLATDRVRVLNRLHVLLRDLIPAAPPRT